MDLSFEGRLLESHTFLSAIAEPGDTITVTQVKTDLSNISAIIVDAEGEDPVT